MNVQLLLIKPSLVQAVGLKQALEQTRHFTVIPFTDIAAALEFLVSAQMDLALVDLESREYDGIETIRRIIETQPSIKVLVSTSDSQLAAQALSLGVVGLLDNHYTARDVVNVLSQMDMYQVDEETGPLGVDRSTAFDVPTDSDTFTTLTADELPASGFEVGDTVTDFIAAAEGALDYIIDEPVNTDLERIDDDPDMDTDTDTPAQAILQHAMADTIPLGEDGFRAYLDQLRNAQEPDTAYVREPDFLPDDAFFVNTDSPAPSTYPDTSDVDMLQEPTTPDAVAAIDEGMNEDTPQVAAPFVMSDDLFDALFIEPEPETDELEVVSDAQLDGLLSDVAESSPAEDLDTPSDERVEEPLTTVDEPLPAEDIDLLVGVLSLDDPTIVQMAVSLTQASLESTADAVFITRGQECIASEGMVSDADMQRFLDVVINAQDPIPDGQSRLRYVTLDSNGIDYLVYSRKTQNDFVLSLVFAGQVALRDMRQQAKRIASALTAVEETPVPVDTPDTSQDVADIEPQRSDLRLESVEPVNANFELYTFVWVLRDSYRSLDHATAEAVNSGLRVQLLEQGYHVKAVDVEDDYVYVLAGIPADEPPQTFVRELQNRAAKIAHTQNSQLKIDGLWADSYFILSPGRALNVQEIQQYINFYRM